DSCVVIVRFYMLRTSIKMTSKPSGTQNRPNDQSRSTTSWTIPEPADVISYSYLWAREAAEAQEEGLKDRPVVVVLASVIEGEFTRLIVAPMTHSKPGTGEGVPVPQAVKRHLSLDDEPSWIVTTEVNRFIWPGPDIRSAKGSDTPLYGAIPSKLFDQVKQQISANHQVQQTSVVKRTE
ncbi:MAG TPA: hypothetical protein VFO45_08760, partial [Sphingomicrobium sp.]|nr:hypothetical protein [Sphingomicrobium sp.]